jgi:hypothetical protein
MSLWDQRPRVLSALALALDRRGLLQESASVLGELARSDPRVREGDSRGPGNGPPQGEEAAIEALALEAADAASATRLWQTYLSGTGSRGPWVEHAQKHLEALRQRALFGGSRGNGRGREGKRREGNERDGAGTDRTGRP